MKRLIIAILFFLVQISNSTEIISNVRTELPKIVTVEELREYFLFKKLMYANGVRVQIFIFNKDSSITRDFLLNTLKVSPSAYFDLLDASIATGRSNLPIIIETESKMVISIAVNSGGLGIVRSAASSSNISSISVISIK